jgi:UDP-N-acetylmuramate: L-alanyl-gamma-D-glutamyl-meso-diaminopimelate ligase
MSTKRGKREAEDGRHLTVHFLGICGTAMGAVAAAMRERGHTVTGQDDNIYPPMSDHLLERGIPVTQGYDPEAIPASADRIVIGNAMTRGNPAVEAVLNRKLPYCSLPGLLGDLFLRGRHNLVVTGTHGKTTTASLLAWVFESAGLAPGWLIGGIPANLGRGANLRDAKHFVIEGDEYDTAFFDKRSKFLHYLPELVVVNNIEFDHADIFRDLEDIKTSFRHFLRIVPSEGMVLVNADDPHAVDVCKACPAPVLEVGFSSNAGNRIHDVGRTAGGSSFTLFGERFEIPLIGDFNIRNAAMAASAAHFYGVAPGAIRGAFASFAGIRRRQEVRGVAAGVTVIDDFGHHPTAIRETLSALRTRHEEARLWALFEPRSNTTRRNIFQHDLPAAFAHADGVFIAGVARLDQIPAAERLDPDRVVADLVAGGKQAFYEPSPAAIVNRLVPLLRDGDVVVVFSNGGFGGIHEMLLDALATTHQ